MRKAMLVLIEDVKDAVGDVVELIKFFKSRNRVLKTLQATLFKRRQEELDAVVDRAATRLQVSGVFLSARSTAMMSKHGTRTS